MERANGKHLVVVRGEIIPYIRLREYFSMLSEAPELEQIMVVETEGGRYGFVVDAVLGDCQTVIKSLSRFYRNVQVISGATILGNGSVALILDPERLAQDAVRGTSSRARGHPCRTGIERQARARDRRSLMTKCGRIQTREDMGDNRGLDLNTMFQRVVHGGAKCSRFEQRKGAFHAKCSR